MTKLDGTSQGGMVVAIQKELGLPIKFIGLGETTGRPATLRRLTVRPGVATP